MKNTAKDEQDKRAKEQITKSLETACLILTTVISEGERLDFFDEDEMGVLNSMQNLMYKHPSSNSEYWKNYKGEKQ